MIEGIVRNRMPLAGLTQARLAEMSGCTPTQMGIFLKETGFLNKKSFEKCLSVLRVRLDVYNKRYQLALNAAPKLRIYTSDEIISMSKSQMVSLTGISEISSLFDVSENEMDNIASAGIVDYEGTYSYFKAMVLHLMQIGGKPSPKSVELSFSKLAAACVIIPTIPLVGITSVIGMATGLLLSVLYRQMH
ncbi:hypothetical protein [Bacteroides sp. 224]|uniref:hypothetical protein n=1 Tax=Bacteroides sp. 224 TaxID=2302936 RepID=UPI0013D0A8C5|nr:hypothetical protein [Bacteroides sp. 224]NDV65931.1 hypothetical protein [Bacteroides sp. 224]